MLSLTALCLKKNYNHLLDALASTHEINKFSLCFLITDSPLCDINDRRKCIQMDNTRL